MDPATIADRYVHHLKSIYPDEDVRLKAEICNLKRKLDESDEFSDNDEELVHELDRVEKKKPKLEFSCDFCGKQFRQKGNKNQHMKTHCMMFNCKKCGVPFSRDYTRKKHERKCTALTTCKHPTFVCKHCGIPFDSYELLFNHVGDNHPMNVQGGSTTVRNINYIQEERESDNIQQGGDALSNTNAGHILTENKRYNRYVRKGALNDNVYETSIIPKDVEKYDLLGFFAETKKEVEEELKARREKVRNQKWYLNVQVEMVKDIEDGRKEKATPHFRSKNYISLENDDDNHNLNEAFQKMNASLEEFIHKGSNWVVNKILSLEVKTVKYSPIAGSSYMELPSKLRMSHSVVNVKNEDFKCFLWSVLAALHPTSDRANNVSRYLNYENSLNLTGINFPVSLSKVEKFEKQNNLSINVFGYEDGHVFPLYLTKVKNGNTEINLLFLSEDGNSHYCWIKHLNRFLGHTHKAKRQYFYCHRCLQGFTRQDLLDGHRPYCDRLDFQKVEFPKDGKDTLEFRDFHKGMRVGFTIYADFEALARQIDTCLPNPNMSSTTHHTRFEACGYAYQVVCSNDNYTKPPVVYRGENAVERFFEDMFKEEECIQSIYGDIEPLIMNGETEKRFKDATHCYICNRMFTKNLIKVRDHSHIGVTGDRQCSNYSNYRGAACQSCNLNLQNPTFIPILFHNFKGFDSHLLIEAAGKYKDKKIVCIPTNMEKYISFSVGNLRFLDSFQFMSESLEKLVDNLSADGVTHFKQFRKSFPSDEVAKLLLRKNVYCYDYVDSPTKFQETHLPSKEAFYNSLKREHISDEDYAHAQTVWTTLNMQTLGEYHDLYLLTDVLLLTDIFERFRTMTIDYYGLDACHFYTAPGLAWQAAMKMSGISLELLKCPDMYNFYELSSKGGIAMACHRYAKANNKYVEGYDPTQPDSYLMYYDANNLYGWAMSQPLPTGMMCWLDEDEIKKFDLHTIPPDGRKGYMLEVDLEYPQELHDAHNSYPLAPSHKKVEDDELSPYSLGLFTDLFGEQKKRSKISKLIPTLENKTNYIVHYRNLQMYTKLGMKVTKIHRIMEFHQTPWLAKYISFNTMKRQQSKNDFEKNFFKLMCNSVFGKTMENLRNRVDIKLVNNENSLRKYVTKPSFERFQIFNEDLVGVENKKTNLRLNKPVYVGATILELSKIVMYDFHYNVMKPRYGDNLDLIFTDTDSLMYQIHTNDIYEDMMAFQGYFDTSGYDPKHPLYSPVNKKIVGKMKDELNGIPINEVVALKPKMYSIVYEENDEQKEKRTAKGIAKCAINKQIRHLHYKQCLFDNKMTLNDMNLIRSENHILYKNHVRKSGLCNFDDKRYWKNSTQSYSYGHFKISNHKKWCNVYC